MLRLSGHLHSSLADAAAGEQRPCFAQSSSFSGEAKNLAFHLSSDELEMWA